jgi:hypothetical protein
MPDSFTVELAATSLPLELGLDCSTLLLLGLRGKPPPLLRLDHTARRLVGGLPFALGLRSAPCLLRLRDTGLLLGRSQATSFFSAACLLLGTPTLELVPGDPKSSLRVRQAASLLLGLRGSTLLLFSLGHAACVLIGSAAIQLGPGSAKSFLRLSQAASLLLRL